MARLYALMDPRTDEMRYIGQSRNTKLRDKGHFNQCKYYETPKDLWIRELRAAGMRPDTIVLEEVHPNARDERERYWIKRARERGVPLLNIGPGGRGTGFPPTPETRRKISESNKGKGHSLEWRAAHAAFMRGRKQSPELRAKRAAAIVANQNARKWDYIAIFPDGRRETIENVGVFCKEHGIAHQRLHFLAAAGEGQTRKGLRFERTERRSAPVLGAFHSADGNRIK
jgi:hypothetical protein